ncbi:MAG TPA: alpha/beta hydrolase [Acidimicrobiales bacterium]|nr:alpha/beta hydrolase [Acidimicrobiales bacterium]
MRSDRLLLAGSALSALNTVNAYRPLATRGRGGLASFTVGWPTSEAPLLTIAGQAAVTALAASRGALSTRTGRLALAIELASWAGLGALAVEAQRSPAVLDAALAAALGARYRNEVPAVARDDAALTISELTLPSLGQRRRFLSARNVSYSDVDARNRLDVWRRADLPEDARAPVLLHVHGGAWVMGDKEVQGEVLFTEMARRGWVCVSITYRLSPRATWPEHIVDVKRAIAWTRATIAERGGDPSFIAITGGSAGGHLAALAALSANDPDFQPGFEDTDTSVQACVPLYGVYDVADLAGTGRRDIVELWERQVMKAPVSDDPKRWEQASPITRVHADAPPMFVIHGANDSLVPVDQARRFVARLHAVSTQPVAYAELPHTQHAFEVFRSVRGIHATRAIARFLDVVHTRAQLARH